MTLPRLTHVTKLKASGHIHNEEVDRQPVTWDQVEIRVDAVAHTRADLKS